MTVKVYVISSDNGISSMFHKAVGFEVTSKVGIADMVVFPGGADINPSMYGEKAIKETHFIDSVDARDRSVFGLLKPNQLKVGICRGGQFLNVMNGGKMWQHVTNHGIRGTHNVIDFRSGEIIPVTSTHHQMMIMGPGGELVAAAEGISDTFKNDQFPEGVPKIGWPEYEPEVIWYNDKRTLCFQPHPEYYNDTTRKYFFDLLDHVL